MKKCIKCGIEKDESEYSKGRNTCKKCRNICIKETRIKYRERYLEMQKQYRTDNPDINKSWRANNAEKIKISNKKRYLKNKDLIHKRNKEWAINNPDKRKNIANNWVKRNPEKVKKNQIIQYLKKQIGEAPPPELVEVKLLINKTKRLCKTLKNCETL